MPNLIPLAIITLIWSGACILSALPFLLMQEFGLALKILSVGLFPAIFVFSFSVLAGLVSLKFHKGIVRGRFPREAFHPVYFCRRMYGAAWTQLYYFKPVYSVVLAIPMLKRLVFKLFGFTGAKNFTVYPDTWIRDLPLLDIGEGAYLANRATLGTNLVLTDGSIMVDRIAVGARSLIGHLCIIGTGAKVGEQVEIGLRTSLGIRVRVENRANIKPSCSINHGTVVGEEAEIGTMSLVGLKCVIGEKIKLPAGSNIPAGTVLLEQKEADRFFSSESADLKKYKEKVIEEYLQLAADA